MREDRDWKTAIRSNSIEAFEDFLAHYPLSSHADEAHTRIETLYFAIAKATNTIEAYESYLETRPNGKFAEDVRFALETLRSQLRDIEEAARSVLPSEAKVKVTAVTGVAGRKDFVISAHLLEGRSANDASPSAGDEASTPTLEEAVQ